jgi:hypothetical protein
VQQRVTHLSEMASNATAESMSAAGELHRLRQQLQNFSLNLTTTRSADDRPQIGDPILPAILPTRILDVRQQHQNVSPNLTTTYSADDRPQIWNPTLPEIVTMRVLDLPGRVVPRPYGMNDQPPEGSSSSRSRCSSCWDHVSDRDIFICPEHGCTGALCLECLLVTFQVAFRQEADFPPKCGIGHHIPIRLVRHRLPNNMVVEFSEKKLEFTIRASERVYCSMPACSAFIPPGNISGERTARCPRCSALTCALCKKHFHAGECTKDTLPEELTHLAEKNKWQQCKECGRYIERMAACPHMSEPNLTTRRV